MTRALKILASSTEKNLERGPTFDVFVFDKKALGHTNKAGTPE